MMETNKDKTNIKKKQSKQQKNNKNKTKKHKTKTELTPVPPAATPPSQPPTPISPTQKSMPKPTPTATVTPTPKQYKLQKQEIKAVTSYLWACSGSQMATVYVCCWAPAYGIPNHLMLWFNSIPQCRIGIEQIVGDRSAILNLLSCCCLTFVHFCQNDWRP
jgi:hypothetical protein